MEKGSEMGGNEVGQILEVLGWIVSLEPEQVAREMKKGERKAIDNSLSILPLLGRGIKKKMEKMTLDFSDPDYYYEHADWQDNLVERLAGMVSFLGHQGILRKTSEQEFMEHYQWLIKREIESS